MSAMRDYQENQRRKAEALARALEPMIAAHFVAEPPPPILREKVRVVADENLVREARGVVDALNKLDDALYSPGERRARLALEKAARQLRKTMQRNPEMRESVQ